MENNNNADRPRRVTKPAIAKPAISKNKKQLVRKLEELTTLLVNARFEAVKTLREAGQVEGTVLAVQGRLKTAATEEEIDQLLRIVAPLHAAAKCHNLSQK